MANKGLEAMQTVSFSGSGYALCLSRITKKIFQEIGKWLYLMQHTIHGVQCVNEKKEGIIEIHLYTKIGNICSTESCYAACFNFLQNYYSS